MSPGDATHQIKSGQVLVAEFAVGARPPVAVLSEILEDETTIDEVIEQLPLCPNHGLEFHDPEPVGSVRRTMGGAALTRMSRHCRQIIFDGREALRRR